MIESLQRRINMATGKEPADLLVTNAKLVNVFTGEIAEECVAIGDDAVIGFGEREARETVDAEGRYLLPGFIDAHIHVESSMLSPARFAELVLPHGTTSVVADPHELVNVSGTAGIRYFLDCARTVPLNLFLALPSCVPATPFEDAGAILTAREMEPFMNDPQVVSIGEMMNFPGVLGCDPDVLEKIRLGAVYRKGVDGHSPGLLGKELDGYLTTGIANTHECGSAEEALANLRRGERVFLREGSAAKTLLTLLPAVTREIARRCAFCCDDRHAEELITQGHMDHILRKAVAFGIDPVMAVTMCTLNAAEALGLSRKGAIAPGRDADMVLVDDLRSFKVWKTFVGGKLVAEDGRLVAPCTQPDATALSETVRIAPLSLQDLEVRVPSGQARVIHLDAGSIVTRSLVQEVITDTEGRVACAANAGVCKIAVIERHRASGLVGTGLLANYGLKGGAIASSVAHDSHNIVVAGDSDTAMLAAVQELVNMQGGCILCIGDTVAASLPLPLAGLMSDDRPENVSARLAAMIRLAHEKLSIPAEMDPFMALSFIALPVIPELKLTARGLFDVNAFHFVSVDANE